MMNVLNIITQKWYYFLATISTFFISIQSFMVSLTILMIIDLIFGIIAAKKSGEKIRSRRMSDTIIKLLVYNILIIGSQVASLYCLPKWMPVTSITVSFLAIVELLSIAENFSRITKQDFISFIKSYLTKFLKNRN